MSGLDKEFIKRELFSFGVTCDENVEINLINLYKKTGNSLEEICCEWVAFVSNQNRSNKSHDELYEEFKKKFVDKENIKPLKNSLPLPIFDYSQIYQDNELSSIYNFNSTPINISKITTSSPLVIFKKLNTSHESSFLSCYFDGTFTQDITKKPTFMIFNKQNLSSYIYMNCHLYKKCSSMNDRIENISKEIMKFNKIDPNNLHSVLFDDMESKQKYIRGRICSTKDHNKLTPDHIYIEGCFNLSEGRRIKLFFNSEICDYSIFPGQVVIILGEFIDQSIFQVEKFFYETFPIVKQPELEFSKNNGDEFTEFFVASGPFSFIDCSNGENQLDLTFTEHLFARIEASLLKTVILIGPLINHTEKIDNWEELYIEIISYISNQSDKNNLDNIFIIPSHLDEPLLSVPVYPTHHYNHFEHSDKLIFLPNPAQISLNDINISICSIDILFHMVSYEINHFTTPPQGDRIDRIIKHLISQNSFYPLFPPIMNDGYFNLDFLLNEKYGKLIPENNFIPQIIIIPSELKGFTKEINGFIFINPGKWIKGKTCVGSYTKARLDFYNKTLNKKNSKIEMIQHPL